MESKKPPGFFVMSIVHMLLFLIKLVLNIQLPGSHVPDRGHEKVISFAQGILFELTIRLPWKTKALGWLRSTLRQWIPQLLTPNAKFRR